MYLKEWHPVLTNGSLPFDTNCFFAIEVTVECASCGISMKFQTDETAPDCNNLNVFIKGQVQEIKKIKPCRNCGTLSELPKTAGERLQNEVTTLITPEWIREARKKAFNEETTPVT